MDDVGGGAYDSNHSVYDPDDESRESLKKSEQSFYHKEGQKETPGKEGLADAEKKGSGLAATAGFYALESVTPLGKVAATLSKHKKGAIIGGGGIASVIVLFVTFFGFIVSHELVTIEQDLLGYEDKAVRYIEGKASKQIMKRIMCNHETASLSPGCNKIKSAEDPQDSTDPMDEAVNNFNINDPAIENGLKAQGISIEKDANGNFVGFKDDNTGQLITTDDLNDPAMMARFENAIPEWGVGQEEIFRSLMQNDVPGTTFDVVGSSEDNAKEDVQSAVEGTDNNTLQLEEANAEDNEQLPKNPTPTESSNYQLNQDSTQGTNKLLQTAENDIKAGDSEATTISDAENSLLGGAKSFFLITAINSACTVYKAAENGNISRIPKIIDFLVRHATTVISLADELKNPGTMSGKQISQITSLFNGDPKYSASSKNAIQRESALPFDRSAAWMRITGQSSSINTNPNSPSYTPDISQSALPTKNAGQIVMSRLSSFMKYSGGSLLCTALSSPIGTLVSVGLGGYQLFSDIFSGGTTQLAYLALSVGIMETLKNDVVPLVIKYFTPVVLSGVEDSVQWMNNADAGANLAFNMYSQRIGGEPLSNQQATALNTQASNAIQLAQAHKSFFQRTFAFSNPDSIISRLIVNLPLSKLGTINMIITDILRSPLLLIHNIGSILEGPRVFAATTTTNPGQAYNFTQYGFPNNDMTKYDPLNNEAYLLHTSISYQGHSNTLINLLGNPNNYPQASYDNSSDDILHCFAPSLNSLVSAFNESSNNNICGSMGNFDTTDLSPQPIGIINVARSFCDQLIGNDSSSCVQTMESMPQLNDIVTRFRQYLLDTEVMSNYTALTS